MGYEFGYCRDRWRLKFAGGLISPHDDMDDAIEWIAKYGHQDGYLYPPISKNVNESRRVIPNTERPKHLFRAPRSHVLTLTNNSLTDSTRDDASFVIHLLGYYLGGWYQFADWWFDARVPLKSTHNIVTDRDTAEHFL